jgi:vacuolar-type H+-ATPase subunit E/Vma4
MAIQDILNTLDVEAQADCDAMIAEAREHAKLIVEDAEHAATSIHEHFAHQVERVAKAEAAKRVNAARLQAKQQISSAKGEGVESVLMSARKRLPSLREDGYDRLFDALAAEALEGVGGDAVVHVAEPDIERAKRAVEASGIAATVSGDLDTVGGLTVEAFGGRLIRRNTLEDRLERASERIQTDVARVLFS